MKYWKLLTIVVYFFAFEAAAQEFDMVNAQVEMQNIYTRIRSSGNCQRTSVNSIAIYQSSYDVNNSSLQINDGMIYFKCTQGSNGHKKLTFNFNTGKGEFLQSEDPEFNSGLRADFDCFENQEKAIECNKGLLESFKILDMVKNEVVAKNNQSVAVQTNAINCATDILASEWSFLKKIIPLMD